MEKILAAKTDMKSKETDLMSAAKSAGGLDNITFQLVRISKSPYKKSVFECKNPSEKKQGKKMPLWIKIGKPCGISTCKRLGRYMDRFYFNTTR
jgi:hypothetical protein